MLHTQLPRPCSKGNSGAAPPWRGALLSAIDYLLTRVVTEPDKDFHYIAGAPTNADICQLQVSGIGGLGAS